MVPALEIGLRQRGLEGALAHRWIRAVLELLFASSIVLGFRSSSSRHALGLLVIRRRRERKNLK
jgi:hypothetical protein